MKKIVITGGSGFIGSNLVKQLSKSSEYKIVIIDNFSTGKEKNLETFSTTAVRMDLFKATNDEISRILEGASSVYHLAANADVRAGWEDRRRDFEQNLNVTVKLLESCVDMDVQDFVFTSTGSVYGEAKEFPTSEISQIPTQTSLYGASKFASECFIQAYAGAGKLRATVFRLVSVLGPNYSHGHVIDFVKQLKKDGSKLKILGDGSQKKSYMHVEDCVRALTSLRSTQNFEVFNIGRNEYCSVIDSARWICEELKVKPELEFTGGEKGWIGDNPFIWLDVTKAKSNGWEAEYSIEESVKLTARWLTENEWMLS